jgi:hypothetical protein
MLQFCINLKKEVTDYVYIYIYLFIYLLIEFASLKSISSNRSLVYYETSEKIESV